MNDVGFHEGERSVQRSAGVLDAADRLRGMLRPPRLDGGVGALLAERDLAVLTGHDRDGTPWISPLHGAPGFLAAEGTALTVRGGLPPGDPLRGLPVPQRVGLLAIDLATRRRIRVNGELSAASAGSMTLRADQAFGNCPSHVRRRRLRSAPPPAGTPDRRSGAAGAPGAPGPLTAADVDLIRRADTLFLGTAHPARGADASHKGGPPGFVRVDGDGIWWPDYAGNNLFNSLGNLAVDPAAALLFLDFGTGRTLHLSGSATVEWVDPDTVDDEGGTGRRVRFVPRRRHLGGVPLRGEPIEPGP